MGIAKDFIQDYQPDTLYLNGDICDFYDGSGYTKDPNRSHNLQDEIDATVELMAEFRRIVPTADIHYGLGNHERRLQSYLWGKSPELAALRCLDFPNLMALNKLGIELYDSHINVTERFRIEHGDNGPMRNDAGYTAKAMLFLRGVSGISGHVHRLGQHYRKYADGVRVWFEGGCLCQLEPEYVKEPNWQQGFTVGRTDGEEVHATLVPIINHKTLLWGEVWEHVA